jgi:hypothetical protein
MCIKYNISSTNVWLNVTLLSDEGSSVTRKLTKMMTNVLQPRCIPIPSTNGSVHLYITAVGYLSSPSAVEWVYFSEIYLQPINDQLIASKPILFSLFL